MEVKFKLCANSIDPERDATIHRVIREDVRDGTIVMTAPGCSPLEKIGKLRHSHGA